MKHRLGPKQSARRWISLALVGSALQLACTMSATQNRPELQAVAAPRQSLFAGVVEVLVDSSPSFVRVLRGSGPTTPSQYALAVDPHPFHAQPADQDHILEIGSVDVSAPTALLESRSRDLRKLGVGEGDISGLRDCPAVMNPDPPRRACPHRPVLVAAVSTPDSADERFHVQVIVISADSIAKNGLVLGYTMARKANRWVLLAQDLPIIIE
jgi:hypothetical protein